MEFLQAIRLQGFSRCLGSLFSCSDAAGSRGLPEEHGRHG